MNDVIKETNELAVVERALRVADQQATAYAILRDRFQYRARLLDVGILLFSTWLVAMTFVEPVIGDSLSPSFVKREIWLGLLSIATFFFSTVQLMVDWKGRAQSYSRSLASTSSFVKTYRGLIKQANPDSAAINDAIAAYKAITDSVESVPESDFLRLKQKHKIKMAISDALDKNPFRSIFLIWLSMFCSDNFSSLRKRGGKK